MMNSDENDSFLPENEVADADVAAEREFYDRLQEEEAPRERGGSWYVSRNAEPAVIHDSRIDDVAATIRARDSDYSLSIRFLEKHEDYYYIRVYSKTTSKFVGYACKTL